ncbi:unnamed protein product, partial [marine sediment metagenome]
IIRSAGDVLEDCVFAISTMVRAGSFRPRLSEVSFGRVKDSGGTLGECEFALPDGRTLSLDGKIDRLDVTDMDGKQTAIVFDYKRKDTSFGWPKFYHGLDMQLPIYMLAVRGATIIRIEDVAGAFYMPIETRPKKIALTEMQEKAGAFRHKAKGIFNGDCFRQLDNSDSNGFYNFFVTKKGDQYGYDSRSGALRPEVFENMLRFSKETIIRLAQQITSGCIDVRPYRLNHDSPCSLCEYRSICRFDPQINSYKLLESVNKVGVLDRLEVDDG